MDRKLNIVAGQEIAIKIEMTSNKARGITMALDNTKDWIFEGVVTKATKKQIYVNMKIGECINAEIFVIDDDYKQKYTFGGANYKLYLSKDDIIEEFQAQQLYNSIKNNFDSFENSNLSLSQLEKIKSIIDEK